MLKNYFKRKSKVSKDINDKKNIDFFIHPTAIFENSQIDYYSYVGPYSIISSAEIGKFCSIGPHVSIGYGDHPTNFLSTSPMFYYKELIFRKTFSTQTHFPHHEKVIIKNDVWIGANTYIKNGLTIGNGAIVAAGAVVIKDVPDYSIVGGVPGKVLKYRFSKSITERIIKLCWWDLDDSFFQENSELWNKELDNNDLDILEKKIKLYNIKQ